MKPFFDPRQTAQKRRFLSTILVLFMLLFGSCISNFQKDIDRIAQITWSPTLAAPVSTGTFTFSDFEEELASPNLVLTSDSDGLIVFVYSEAGLFSQTAEQIIEIEDQVYNTGVSLPAGQVADLPVQGTVIYTQNDNFAVQTPDNDDLDSTALKGGTLELDLQGDFPASGSILLRFESLLAPGSPFETTFSWTYDGVNAQQSFQQSIPLGNTFIDFTSGGTTSNVFDFTSEITLIYEGQPVTTANRMDIDISFTDVLFQSIFATLSPRVATNQVGSFELEFTNETEAGDIFFEDPRIIFDITNGFGAPVDISIVNLRATGGQGTVDLTGLVVDNLQPIAYPDITMVGAVVSSQIMIDNSNSNLADLLASRPRQLEYEFEGLINSAGIDEAHFALDNSQLDLDLIFEIPLHGRIRNLAISEPYDFDGSGLDEVDNALFRITTTNGFPLEADVQIHFLDNGLQVLDSLIYDDTRIISAGLVDTEGKVTTPTQKEVDIVLDSNRLAAISQATRIRLLATLNTANGGAQSVKILDTDEITIQLFLQTQFTFN